MAAMKAYFHPELSAVPLSTALQALSDPCRVAIVRMMLAEPEREFACNEFPVELSKATVSHHFETLRGAGLIKTRVEGTRCLSKARAEAFSERFPGLLELVRAEIPVEEPATSSTRN